MNSSYKVKQITSLYDSCDRCGLPVINCICDKIEDIKSEAEIWILSTRKEFYRPSNTARLIKLVNPISTEIFLWERTKRPEGLIEKLNNDMYEPYLLFPVYDEDTRVRKVEFKQTDKTPAFIILDGTWKEAKKIFRKSDYLGRVPIISIEPDFESNYDLRRGSDSGNLCTIETAIEVLKLNRECDNVNKVSDVYNLFLKSYKASASGHEFKSLRL